MPQYTDTKTSAGFAVNAVLDTEASQIVYTVTAPNGAVATITTDSKYGAGNSDADNLIDLLVSAGALQGTDTNADRPARNAISNSLRSVTRSVLIQNRDATAAAVATGEPPPAEKQAIPPPANSDPAVENKPTENTETVDNKAPETVTADQDPFEASRQAAEQNYDNNISASDNVIDDGSDPYVSNGQSTIPPAVESPNPGILDSIKGLIAKAQTKATKDDATSFQKKLDWRVRLSLAPGANYLYKVGDGAAGILNPLQKTDGVVFPYTPAINVSYTAGYDASDIVHSNYKVYQYKGSSVDNLNITAEFTAQDTNEANYLLAVIHFFRSVTKMFYGQDQNPKNGVPPPLLYLSGMGTYQFDNHPLAITNFTYSLPTDVDYIRAGSQTNQPGQNLAGQQTPVNNNSVQQLRTVLNKLVPSSPIWNNQQSLINSEATYVPTKMQIQLSAIPVVTRNDISNNFSLRDYSTGKLLRGSQRSGGGIW